VFFFCQLEGKIGGKTVTIALDRFVEPFGLDAIDPGKVSVENDPLTPDFEDRQLGQGVRRTAVSALAWLDLLLVWVE
jgi:hypothetical protein